jgi:hypothetical protein
MDEEVEKIIDEIDKQIGTDELVKSLKDLSNTIDKLKVELPNKLKVENKLDFPEAIKISNFPDPIEIPDEITIRQPDWWEQINREDLEEVISELRQSVEGSAKVDLERYREPGKALAVRLVNRKGTDFYEALATAMGSAGVSSFPFERSSGRARAALVDGDGHVQVDIQAETAPSTIVAFVTDVPNAGTRVQLANNVVIAGIIQAPSTNTGNVYIGGSDVSSAVFGSELQPGQSAGIAIDNTNNIWIDAATNGDDVAFLGS